MVTKQSGWMLGVGILVCLVLFLWWGMRAVYCGQVERTIPLPSALRDAQVQFETPMYYQAAPFEEYTKTFKTIKYEIDSDDPGAYQPGYFKYIPLSTSTIFSVVEAVNNAQCGLSSIDSGTSGVNWLILRDSSGSRFAIPEFEFWSSERYPFEVDRATYYINGKKAGYITSSTFLGGGL